MKREIACVVCCSDSALSWFGSGVKCSDRDISDWIMSGVYGGHHDCGFCGNRDVNVIWIY